MIGFLSGTIVETHPTIISVGGVGYIVHLPEKMGAEMVEGATERFFIHTHVREDALDLYGFRTKEELELFELLLTVSGIGPRTSLTIINHGVTAIQKAVAAGDVDFFTSIPRLGRKNAQKIIIELKNKLGSLTDLDLRELDNTETKQVLDALVTMGFAKKEALDAIKKLNDKDSLEQKVRKALQLLGKNI